MPNTSALPLQSSVSRATPTRRLLTVFALAGSAACTSASSGRDMTVAAMDAAAPTDAADAQCNSVKQQGSVVTATASADKAPVPAGGTPASGAYVLTSVVEYGASQLIPYQNTSSLEVAGTTVYIVENTGKGDKRKNGDGTVNGTHFTLKETCAFPARSLLVEEADFTATDSQIMLFGAVGAVTLVQTYTRK